MELCTTGAGRIKSSVEHEYNVLKQLEGAAGFPRPLWFGREAPYYALVIDNLGPSLHNIFLSCGRKFSLHNVIILGEQLVSISDSKHSNPYYILHWLTNLWKQVSRLEHLHSRNYIHRDIKPQNVLVGTGDSKHTAFIIDFGVAKEYRDFTTRAHIPFRDNCPLVGTPAFASINVHLGVEGGRRDDIESLAYMLIYFLRGSLSWLSDTHISKATILKRKQEVSAECLCCGLPYEFATILLYARTLDFSQKPDYDYIRLLLHGLRVKHAIPNDGLLDFSESMIEVHDPSHSCPLTIAENPHGLVCNRPSARKLKATLKNSKHGDDVTIMTPQRVYVVASFLVTCELTISYQAVSTERRPTTLYPSSQDQDIEYHLPLLSHHNIQWAHEHRLFPVSLYVPLLNHFTLRGNGKVFVRDGISFRASQVLQLCARRTLEAKSSI